MTDGDSGRETGIARGPRDFPSTCWSRFLGVAAADPARRRTALEELARIYWRPVYAYVRAKWGRTIEDAKDLTQDFFVWMLETDFLGRADPARGKFRAFVKVALSRYLSKEERDRRTLKRGGGLGILALDAAAAPPDPAGKSPEQALDDAWKAELLSRAENILQEQLQRAGRDLQGRIFRDYYRTAADDLNYREVAARHGVSEADVLEGLRRTREAFRGIVTDLVSETVRGPEELRDEMRALFGGERS